MFKKMHMISFQYSGESGDKLQDYVITKKHIVTFTIMDNTTTHPGY